MTLSDLRAQAMDPLTPEQLRAASDAALLLCGWRKYRAYLTGGRMIWSRSGTDRQAPVIWDGDQPNPAADLTDAAALMPEGWVVQVNTFDDDAIVTVWRSDDPAFVQNEETACTEPYARMLAAVAAHMEDKT